MKRVAVALSVSLAMLACSPRGSAPGDLAPEEGISEPGELVPIDASAQTDVATMSLLPAPAAPTMIPIRRRPEAPGGPALFSEPTTDVVGDPSTPSPSPSGNFQALPDNGMFIPPDTDGAVGPSHLMVALNSQVRMQDRAGNPISTVTLASFWSSLGSFSSVFDPKVQYDPTINRWLFVTIADAEAPTSAVLLGVSATSDPTGSWNLYKLATGSPGNWADYPSFGYNGTWIVLSTNIFNNAGTAFIGTKTFVFSKAAAAAGTLTSATAFTTPASSGDFTICPAITTDASQSSTEYLLEEFSGAAATLRLFRLSGSVGAETLTQLPAITGPSPWAEGSASEILPQAGSAQKIDGGDARMQNVVYNAGALWSTFTAYLPASTPTRTAVQWFQVNPANSTVVQSGRIDDATGVTFFAYPTIAVNANGDALLGFGHFAASEFPSAAYAYRVSSDAVGTFHDPFVFKTGLAKYFKDFGSGANRWGDYSNTVVDPVNGGDFWTIQEVSGLPSGGMDQWLTWWAHVIAVNRAPTLAAISDQTILEDAGPQTVTLSGITAGPATESAQTLAISAVSSNPSLIPNPTIGAISAGSATLSYAAGANANGTATITVTLQDNGGTSGGGADTVTRAFLVTVTAVNDPPVGVADSYSTNEDVQLGVSAPGVLANDTDIEGSALTAVLSAGPAHGTLSLAANGSFLYTPNASYNGPDSFAYLPNDGSANGNVTTVSITVNPVNDAPIGVADSYSTAEDTTLTVGAAGVLSNDTDADGDSLTATLQNPPIHGTLTFATDGSFVYVPDANFSGNDSFTYVPNDGATSGASTTVSLTVTATNDPPVGVNDSYSVNENSGTTTFAAPGPLGNDTDGDGDTLSMQVQSSTTHGTLTFNANGQFSYTPNAGFFGSDAFTYEPFDGTVLGNLTTVAISVVHVNTPPVSVADSYTTNEDTMLSVAAPGVLANDSDADADAITASLVANVAHGMLTLAANGSFTYLPDANFNGMDSFDYRANDGTANGNTVTVTIMVTAVNDPPVAVADSGTTAEDTPLSAAAPGVLANDTDVDSMTLTAVLVSGPTHGMVMLNANGSYTYTPDPDFDGSDSFSYAANDGMANGNTTAVSVTVTPVNDAPIAVVDSAGVMEDAALDVAAPGVLANDTDVDDASLTAVLVTGPAHGTLTLAADGSYQYQPDADFNGDDSFTYHANDGAASSQDVTTTIHVAPVNDFPTIPVPIGPVAATVFKTPDVSFSWNASTDVDGDAITYHFTVKKADGTTYQDTPTYNTTISFLGPNGFENGDYTWEVEALDSNGATLGPIAPIAFTVSHHAGGSGCGCDTTGGVPSAGAIVPGLMLIAVLSRRILMAR